ncbi:stage 0 sporulation protein [bacterium]|nr:stage 0 sporulation protein [bacterium]
MRYAVRLVKNILAELDVPEEIELENGQMVLAYTDRGEEAFKVIAISSTLDEIWKKKRPIRLKFIRKMSKKDLDTLKNIHNQEIEAKLKCAELIKYHKLNMRLTQCRITFDRRKIMFIYTAPERVDFRELLKSLTQAFRGMRIELKHVGVRDETALLSGCGICGKELCCSSFLRKFEQINVKVAKDQGCAVSAGKLAGMCGRLLCCLNYEYSNYLDAAIDMPPIGSSVMTADGLGKIYAIRFLTSKVCVKLEDGKVKDFDKENVEIVDADVNVDITNESKSYLDEVDYDYKQMEE